MDSSWRTSVSESSSMASSAVIISSISGSGSALGKTSICSRSSDRLEPRAPSPSRADRRLCPPSARSTPTPPANRSGSSSTAFRASRAATMLERREWVRANCDHLRTALMLEPRGHADMYGALLTEPEHPDSDAGVLFMHNEGYSTMCGHGVIAVVTMAIERGLIVPRGGGDAIVLDSPAGQIRARARDVGSDGDRTRRRACQLRQRAVVRAARRRCRSGSARATFAPTWRSAARSTPSSTAKSAGLARRGRAPGRAAARRHGDQARRRGRGARRRIPTSPSCTASTAPSSPGRRRPTMRTCAT